MEIIKIDEVGIDEAAAKAAAIIAQGGVVVYPTDTLYGLGVNAFDALALERMREVKGRDKKKPVSILLPSVEHIARHTQLSPAARALAENHLPGALTLVLPAREHVPKELTLNGAVGVRVPNDEFSRTLAAMSEYPVTATSANLAGHETPETIPEIIRSFGHKIALIDLFIDAGRRSSEPASTVVAYINDVPHVLREGAISKKELGL